jgi:hypothetical protein
MLFDAHEYRCHERGIHYRDADSNRNLLERHPQPFDPDVPFNTPWLTIGRAHWLARSLTKDATASGKICHNPAA